MGGIRTPLLIHSTLKCTGIHDRWKMGWVPTSLFCSISRVQDTNSTRDGHPLMIDRDLHALCSKDGQNFVSRKNYSVWKFSVPVNLLILGKQKKFMK